MRATGFVYFYVKTNDINKRILIFLFALVAIDKPPINC